MNETYSYGEMIDVGDADIVHTDVMASHNRTQFAMETIIEAGKTPFVLGGDHSITAPLCAALAKLERNVTVLQIDAHLDFVDERHGVRYGHGNCMRRCLEMPHVTGMLQLGIRGVSSTAKSGFEDAQSMGSQILSVRKVRELGPQAVAELLRAGAGRAELVGMDLVEVSPPYDPAGVTATLAARILLDVVGFASAKPRRDDCHL